MITGSADMREVRLLFVERRHEYDDAYTYVFRSPEAISFIPGEYGHVRLFGMPEGVKAVREFSFASAPYETDIWFGVDSRSGSPYQKRLMDLTAGDEVGLFKIKGHMAWPPESYSDVVMIAGGVGITPFRSQLLDVKNRTLSLRTSVIHASQNEYLYGEEIARLADEYHTVRRDTLAETLLEVVGRNKNAMYFIAGPTGFVETVNGILHDAGISAIQSDTFKGLAD